MLYEWLHLAAYTIESNTGTETHYTKCKYIDGNPSYTWCIAGYIKSGIDFLWQVNVEWVQCHKRDARLHLDAKLLHVWTVATKSILAGEELIASYAFR
jgi:hypothetical protein